MVVWLAVNKDREERLFVEKPKRDYQIGKDLTWEDEPVKLERRL